MRKLLTLIFCLTLSSFFFLQASLQNEQAPVVELNVGAKLRGFRVTKAIDVPEWQAKVVELEHEQSGAQVLHIQTDDPENFFCLSFQTQAPTSNGVAHVLEHSVL